MRGVQAKLADGVGSRVRVRELEGVARKLRGMRGTIRCRYGHPERANYDVRLDDGRTLGFWYYQLEHSE